MCCNSSFHIYEDVSQQLTIYDNTIFVNLLYFLVQILTATDESVVSNFWVSRDELVSMS